VTATLVSPRPAPRLSGGARVLALLCLLAMGGVILLARGWHPLPSSETIVRDRGPMSVPRSREIEATHGIRFTTAAVTAHGGMIHLQFQVLDEAKAATVHSTDNSPVVVAGGFRFDAPGMAGHGTHAKDVPDAGSSGFTLLANVGGRLAPGTEVDIVVGELVLEHVVLG
jgi:hypothetical protein